MEEDEEPVTADCDTLEAQQPLSLSIGGGFNWNFESQQLISRTMADSEEEEEEDEAEVLYWCAMTAFITICVAVVV